jgi:hypothetical protein
MKPTTKAMIYVSLAMLEPVTKTVALSVEKAAWPNQFELAAMAVGMLYLGLLTLKAWSSEPNPEPKA